MAQQETGVGSKSTGSTLTAAEFNSVNNTINNNSIDAELRLMDAIKVRTLADLSQFLNVDVYEIPNNINIVWAASIDFGLNRIDFVDLDSCNRCFGSCVDAVISYTGTGNFISNSGGGTILQWDNAFISTPNGTGINFVNGNSLIMTLSPFFNCKTAATINTLSFLTFNDMPVIACEQGLMCVDVQTATIKLPQFNSGQDLGGCMFTFSGAASERLIASTIDSRPEATEAMFDIQASYGGEVTIGVGSHTGPGSFFKGVRDQDDVDINIQSVTNVPNSQAKVKGYVGDGDEVETTITTQDVPVVIAGTWTNTIAKRFSLDAAGKIIYLGHETTVFPIIAKLQATPASGTNREYDFHFRVNGSTIDPASRDAVRADSGNPAKAVIITELELAENDYVEIIVTATNSTINLTASAVTVII